MIGRICPLFLLCQLRCHLLSSSICLGMVAVYGFVPAVHVFRISRVSLLKCHLLSIGKFELSLGGLRGIVVHRAGLQTKTANGKEVGLIFRVTTPSTRSRCNKAKDFLTHAIEVCKVAIIKTFMQLSGLLVKADEDKQLAKLPRFSSFYCQCSYY